MPVPQPVFLLPFFPDTRAACSAFADGLGSCGACVRSVYIPNDFYTK